MIEHKRCSFAGAPRFLMDDTYAVAVYRCLVSGCRRLRSKAIWKMSGEEPEPEGQQSGGSRTV